MHFYRIGVDALIVQDMGITKTESSSDTTSCQYADGQSYAGKSEVPLGSRFPSSGVGAGVSLREIKEDS